jgi:orotidine-5'-phosphate decarboxylase
MEAKDRIIVALDVDSLDKAKALVELLSPYVGCFKVGLELLTVAGAPQAVAALKARNAKVMFDGKFHDIPNTMAGAARSVAAMGADMFTMHAAAGTEGMKAAVAAKGTSLSLAVTVLTSMDSGRCIDTFSRGTEEMVFRFASDAVAARVDGIVCSPKELQVLCGRDEFDYLVMVTPGVRPEWAAVGDQKRVMTPKEAVAAGADYLVIGRPILSPPASIGSPIRAAQLIAEEISEASND